MENPRQPIIAQTEEDDNTKTIVIYDDKRIKIEYKPGRFYVSCGGSGGNLKDLYPTSHISPEALIDTLERKGTIRLTDQVKQKVREIFAKDNNIRPNTYFDRLTNDIIRYNQNYKLFEDSIKMKGGYILEINYGEYKIDLKRYYSSLSSLTNEVYDMMHFKTDEYKPWLEVFLANLLISAASF